MSAAGAIDLPRSLSPAPQGRVTAKVREAVRLMVEEALPRREAAEKAGMTDNGLWRALQSPAVIAYRTQLFGVLRSSEASRTISRAAKLADSAESEHVRLQANTWLAEIDGVAPPDRHNPLNVNIKIPGLVIMRAPDHAPGDDARLIDGQAREVGKPSHVIEIGEFVPHPSQRNAAMVTTPAGISGPRRAEGEGQK